LCSTAETLSRYRDYQRVGQSGVRTTVEPVGIWSPYNGTDVFVNADRIKTVLYPSHS